MAKSKYILHQCAYCHKQTKMELVGGMQNEGASEEAPLKVWYRCTRCKHSALLDAMTVQKEKSGNLVKIERSDCLEYSKEKVYPLGQAIYHAGLDDVGKVVKKDKMSNGIHSITVSFEKLGERKLMENVPVESSAELATSQS